MLVAMREDIFVKFNPLKVSGDAVAGSANSQVCQFPVRLPVDGRGIVDYWLPRLNAKIAQDDAATSPAGVPRKAKLAITGGHTKKVETSVRFNPEACQALLRKAETQKAANQCIVIEK